MHRRVRKGAPLDQLVVQARFARNGLPSPQRSFVEQFVDDPMGLIVATPATVNYSFGIVSGPLLTGHWRHSPLLRSGCLESVRPR